MCLLRCAVLYSYNPRRPEELELKKGEMVGVYGKFKEGWLRGLSLRTGRVGILPSNYISPVLRLDARIWLVTAGANRHQITVKSSVSLQNLSQASGDQSSKRDLPAQHRDWEETRCCQEPLRVPRSGSSKLWRGSLFSWNRSTCARRSTTCSVIHKHWKTFPLW